MKWKRVITNGIPDPYYLASDPPGYTIALYFCGDIRNLVAWRGNQEIGHRHGITTKEAHTRAIVELKAICEDSAMSSSPAM